MAPPLFSRVTRAQALSAFGMDAEAETDCGEQFVKLDRVGLVFATLGVEGTRLAYADCIEWRGHQLPNQVRDVFDRDGKRIFHHVMLVRGPRDGDSWLYCGRVHLGGWGGQDGLIEASFSLEEGRLTPEDWRALGGHESWQIHLKGEAREFAPDDAAGFADWLADVGDDEMIDIFMIMPSGATFAIFVNATRAAVFFMEGMAEPFSLSLRDPSETSDVEETFFENLGPAEFTHERFRTIPRAAALRASILAFHGLLAPQSGLEIDCDGFRARWSDW